MELSRYKRARAAAAPSLPGSLLTAALVIAGLYFGSDLFVPLAIAVLLSFVLTPLVVGLRRFRIPRAIAVVLVVVSAFSIIFGLGALMGGQVTALLERLPQYEWTLRQKIRDLRPQPGAPAGIVERTTETLQNLGKELDERSESPSLAQPKTSAGPQPIPVEIHSPPPAALEYFQRIVQPLLEPLASTGLVLILVIFILLQREDLRDRLIRLFGVADLGRTTDAIDDAARRLSRLYLTLTTMNAVYGAGIAVALWLIGLPNPLLWGILAGLLRFVPYIGTVIALVFPVLLAAAVEPGWSLAALTLIIFIVGEFTMGQVLEPWLLGSSTGLSPLAVIAAASFWTWLWGPIGLLLAIPLTVSLMVLGRHVPQLNFIYVLLGDEPALTAAQRFYQRMLAGDIDEITYDAEQFVKSKSLLCYFDEVALPALVMAQADVRRERLGPDRLSEMRELIGELIEELEDVEIGKPPPKAGKEDEEQPSDLPVLAPEELKPGWRVAEPVLSVGVRNPLDQAAAEILAHLAAGYGVGTRVIGASEVTTAAINQLDIADAKLAVLSNVDTARAPAHARLMMRRLRRRNPNLKFLIGAWGESEAGSGPEAVAPMESGPAIQRMTSLRSALGEILREARAEPSSVPIPARKVEQPEPCSVGELQPEPAAQRRPA
jgi:predicted PurR-regulated permease PerM